MRNLLMTSLLLTGLAGGYSAPLYAATLLAQDFPTEDVPPNEDSTGSPEDVAAVTAAVDAFMQALNDGDNAAAMALLAPDSMFLEGGGLETYAEYRDNHLPADIEFEEQVDGIREFMRVTVEGDQAWVITTHYYDGEFDETPLSFELATLSILSRQDGAWKFRAVHWSSR
jgi:ketosteroid isomerase-like protein